MRKIVKTGSALTDILRRRQAVRFLLVGVGNTIFGYLVYLAGLGLRMTPTLALALATALGIVFNYVTTARLVFAHRTSSRFPMFIAAYVVTYVVNVGAIQVLLRAGLTPALAQALLVPFMAALSFVLLRTFVFGRPRPA